eukprot:TRINITY_DN14151_c0_g1_i2.p1 TRINITY_DN14151_c0_g1~~TRINITY_DN14151_c0_g1_i2.p1  ORF type:complete len:664 (-),score=92.16 TRINITY_DN14151_c0_g1_i2:1005-2996(-)
MRRRARPLHTFFAVAALSAAHAGAQDESPAPTVAGTLPGGVPATPVPTGAQLNPNIVKSVAVDPCQVDLGLCWGTISQLTGRAPTSFQADSPDPLALELVKETGATDSEGNFRTDLRSFDELTFEFQTSEQPATLELSLPERNINCRGKAENKVCDGYDFAVPNGCGLLKALWASDDSTDLVEKNLIKKCTTTYLHLRSALKITFEDGVPLNKNVQFTVPVKNPPYSPFGYDLNSIWGNAVLVAMENADGKRIPTSEGLVLEARSIMPLWECVYSAWMDAATCTAECGGGQRFSVRHILNPPPEDYDTELLVNCNKDLSRATACNVFPCAIDCQLGDWTAAEVPCTKSCGGGTRVERRRVVESAQSGGAPCVSWDSERREREVPCNTMKCVIPPSEEIEKEAPDDPFATSEDIDLNDVCVRLPNDEAVMLNTPCSAFCGKGGARYGVPLTPLKFAPDQCDAWGPKPCNLEACTDFQFFSSYPGTGAVRGQWFDLTIGLGPPELADSIEVISPVSFGFDHQNDKSCRFIEHTLPRIENCTVSVDEDFRSKISMTFLNPLEPREGRTYEIRLFVHHPTACNTTLPDYGVCENQKDWMLKYKANEPNLRSGEISGGYAVYISVCLPVLIWWMTSLKDHATQTQVTETRHYCGLRKRTITMMETRRV